MGTFLFLTLEVVNLLLFVFNKAWTEMLKNNTYYATGTLGQTFFGCKSRQFVCRTSIDEVVGEPVMVYTHCRHTLILIKSCEIYILLDEVTTDFYKLLICFI